MLFATHNFFTAINTKVLKVSNTVGYVKGTLNLFLKMATKRMYIIMLFYVSRLFFSRKKVAFL